MKIKLTRGQPASQDDIAVLQHKVGKPLDPAYLEFLKSNDGAEPENNSFSIGETNAAGVNRFIPVRDIPGEMVWIEGLPDGAFPVAWAEGGNYVFIDQGADGGVFFWDHELPDGITRLADSFARFLQILEPFDIDAIDPSQHTILKAWIDPDFLKSIKE